MIIHECDQGSEQWEALRAGKITASRFDSIFTAAKCEISKSSTKYIRELIAACCCPEFKKWTGNRATDRGTEMEPIAREEFAKATGLSVKPVGFVTMEAGDNPYCSAIGCSPDGLIVDDAGEYIAGLEIKAPYPDTHVGYVLDAAAAREELLKGRHLSEVTPALQQAALSLGLPDAYKQQVHGSLIVTGLPVWHFWSYFPGMQPLHCIVRPDDYTAKLKAALLAFARTYAAALESSRRHLVPNVQA